MKEESSLIKGCFPFCCFETAPTDAAAASDKGGEHQKAKSYAVTLLQIDKQPIKWYNISVVRSYQDKSASRSDRQKGKNHERCKERLHDHAKA